MLLDGRKLAAEIERDLAQKNAALSRPASLAVVLASGDEASEIYVRNKAAACERVGMKSLVRRLDASASEAELLAQISELNNDASVDGILLQLPLPAQINRLNALGKIAAVKDVDGLGAAAQGALALGDESGFVPCTPLGIIRLLEHHGIELCGANCCVVSESIIVGRPLALMLLNRGASVQVVHKFTADLAAATACADVLISATGQANLIGAAMVKKGAVMVDVGVAMHGARGDIAAEAKALASAYSPVPGGVGPMTVAMLLENTYKAALRRENGR